MGWLFYPRNSHQIKRKRDRLCRFFLARRALKFKFKYLTAEYTGNEADN